MEGNHWNFCMMPPLAGNYKVDEINAELIHSSKAFYVCHKVAQVFAECTKKPSGKIVNPEICKNHADALITCYNEVKIVPADCQNAYNKVLHCLRFGKNCEKELDQYILCDHPATKTYETYH